VTPSVNPTTLNVPVVNGLASSVLPGRSGGGVRTGGPPAEAPAIEKAAPRGPTQRAAAATLDVGSDPKKRATGTLLGI